MIEWSKVGRKILATRGNELTFEERNLLTAYVNAAELSGRVLEAMPRVDLRQ